jgi:hypothetical protein
VEPVSQRLMIKLPARVRAEPTLMRAQSMPQMDDHRPVTQEYPMLEISTSSARPQRRTQKKRRTNQGR